MSHSRFAPRHWIAAGSLVAGVAMMSLAQEPAPVVAAPSPMSSQVFDWDKLTAKNTAKGQVRKVCQAPTATLDELECHITTLNPGEEAHPPHQHPDEEIIVVKEGTVESLVNGNLVRVGPGSVIFQAANQMHSIRNVGDTPATYHVIKWNSPGMLKGRLQKR
ncbi:cupin domain-containing protein [Verrucomicrobium sp. BvORR034]|uniref:cupin domain-containing protein n=1 Tax=Verrucomicrobium sp. BvORR034 TaxID=1396418 RepID=UPI000679A621|nr:cupin domain-containing protein [Verrucomicrobium sp. BvORR034]